jgi:hypothetical protein
MRRNFLTLLELVDYAHFPVCQAVWADEAGSIPVQIGHSVAERNDQLAALKCVPYSRGSDVKPISIEMSDRCCVHMVRISASMSQNRREGSQLSGYTL